MRYFLILIGLFLNFHSVFAQIADSIAFQSQTDTVIYSTYNPATFPEYNSLSEALNAYPDVFIKNAHPGGVQTISAQGLNVQHVQVLWNGIPVNSGMLGIADLSLFTVGYKQNISYYSQRQDLATGGLAGVVNIEDKMDWNQEINLGVRQSVGSFGQLISGIQHQGAVKNQSWSIGASYEKANNRFEYNDYTVFPNVNKTLKNAEFHQWSIYPKWKMKLKNGSQLYGFLEAKSIDRNIPPFLVTPNNIAEQKDRVLRQMLRWNFEKNKFQHQISGLFAYNRLIYNDYVLSRSQDNREHLAYLRYKGTWRFLPKWEWSYGSDFKFTQVLAESYAQSVHEWGEDIHTAILFQPNLYVKIKGLVKWTKRTQLKGYFPFLLESEFYTGKNHQWKVWLHTGMDARYPTLNDRYWMPGGNRDLSPETNFSLHAGSSVKWNIRNCLSTQQVEFFVNRIQDMIIWYPTNKGYFQPQNEGKVIAYGATILQNLDWAKGFHNIHLQFSYAMNRSGNMQKQSANDKTQWVQLPYFPIHSGKMLAAYQWKNLAVNMDAQVYSFRNVSRDGEVYLPAYGILNSTLSYLQKMKNFDIEARMSFNNLLNAAYEEVRYRPMPKRNYLFTLILIWKHEKN